MLVNAFFPSVPGRISSESSWLYLRVLSALQPYVRTLTTLFISQAIEGGNDSARREMSIQDFGSSFGEGVSMFLVIREIVALY